MTNLATLPEFPVPERSCRLTFGLAEAGANYLRVWVTDAPDGSAKKAELEKNGEKRIHLYSGDASSIDFDPDVGGVYKLVAQEYVKGSAYGGAYEGDPNGAPSETKAGSEVTLSLVVGQRVTQTLGYGSDTATLVWWIFGDRVRATSLTTHGEETPAIVEPTSMRARIAAHDPSVLQNLSTVAGALVSDLVGSIEAVASTYATKFAAHMAMGTSVHNPGADTYNPLPAGLASSVGPANLADVVNRLLATMRQHFLNVDGANGGDIGSGVSHTVGGFTKSDRANLPIVQSVGDLGQAYAALGDIYRCYRAHQLSTNVHGAADNTNNFGAVPALVGIHRYFFSSLAAQDPTVPETINSGVVTAVSLAGFTEG